VRAIHLPYCPEKKLCLCHPKQRVQWGMSQDPMTCFSHSQHFHSNSHKPLIQYTNDILDNTKQQKKMHRNCNKNHSITHSLTHSHTQHYTYPLQLSINNQLSTAARVAKDTSTLATMMLADRHSELLLTPHTLLHCHIIHPLTIFVILYKLCSVNTDRCPSGLLDLRLPLELLLGHIGLHLFTYKCTVLYCTILSCTELSSSPG
jgi:hypothetical protein